MVLLYDVHDLRPLTKLTITQTHEQIQKLNNCTSRIKNKHRYDMSFAALVSYEFIATQR